MKLQLQVPHQPERQCNIWWAVALSNRFNYRQYSLIA
nr:MAG TPA: Carbamoyl phosphate synthetase [Caudoviricetes sp.]